MSFHFCQDAALEGSWLCGQQTAHWVLEHSLFVTRPLCASLCACVQEGLRCSKQDFTLITSHRQVDWRARGFRRQSVTPVTPKEPTCPLSQSSRSTHGHTYTYITNSHRLMETAVVLLDNSL